MNNKYENIINLPHHTSPNYERMPLNNRAAQFAPFSALAGYDEAIKQKQLEICQKIILSEDAEMEISKKLNALYQNISKHPYIQITYFVDSKIKCGGEYKTEIIKVKNIDIYNNILISTDGKKIHFDSIASICLK